MATPGAALELAMQTLLDGENPMVKFNGTSGKWCCLLCKRQFPTDKQLGQHCQASQLHKTNVAEAEASGRIRGPATTSPLAPLEDSRAAAKRPLPEEDAPRPAKASRWGDPPAEPDQSEPSSSAEAGGSASQGRMSALEQMELFEKRLKVQEKRKPEKEKGADEETEIDSNRARTINNQMDWECGQCGQFNFARSVSCHSCHHHVDKDTKYLSNRLKELKHERFSRVFGGSEQLSRAGLEAGAREQAVTAENNLGGAMLQGMGWRGGGLGRDEGGTTEAPRGRGARHFGQ